MQSERKVNIHAKSGLARLMAIENLSVIHNPAASTASFDIKNRVLTFPVLKEMNDFIYDAFCAHEIGHALYTPYEKTQWETLKKEIPFVFLNITEDARIEKLVQRRYPGTKRDFREFYSYCTNTQAGRDFFGLEGKNINTMSLIDKINIHFKLGDNIKVIFSPEEMPFVKMVAAEETFQDAIDAAKAILEYMKQNGQVSEMEVSELMFGDGEEGESSGQKPHNYNEDGEGKGNSSSSSGKEDGQECEGQSCNEGNKAKKQGNVNQGVGSTQSNFDKNSKNLFEAPTNGMSFGDIKDISDIYRKWSKDKKFEYTNKSSVLVTPGKESLYTSFITGIGPVINMMVGQFNMKKAAKDFEKTKTSRTGKLDMDKISQYRTSGDVFLQTEYIPEHKNHGIVMFLDCSSSMSGYFEETTKQTLIMTEFCRRLSIPFEVYGFTGGSNFDNQKTYPGIGGQGAASVFLLLASSQNHRTYKDMASVLLAGKSISMGNTPLNDAAFKSEYILREFKAKHRVEKLTLVVLTDGDPTDGIADNDVNAKSTVIMRDPVTNKNYSFNNRSTSYHDIFKYIIDAVGVTSSVGFFLTDNLTPSNVSLIAPGIIPENQYNDFKSKGCALFKDGKAFKKYFAVNINNFGVKAAEDGMDDKQLNDIKKNMIFMNTFVNEIS